MRLADVRRWFDARLLMWLTAVVVASGLPLLIGYDPGQGSSSLISAWPRRLLRSVHAVSSFLVVVGVVVHLVARIARHEATHRAIRSGAVGLLTLGLAAVSGAMIVRTADASALVAAMGLGPARRTVVLAAAVFHIAYSVLLVLLTLYWHVGRLGPRQTFGGWRRGVLAAGIAVAFGTLVLGTFDGPGHAATRALAPPMTGLWAWILALAVLLALLAGPFSRPRSDRRPGPKQRTWKRGRR